MTELSYQHKQTLGETRHVVDENTFFDDIVPGEVTDVIRAFAAEFSPLPPLHVPLRKDAQAIYGWPADGVGEKIRTHGGSIRFGWRMREWPNILLTAEAHAVWVDPDGALIDITPDVADGDISLFVPTSEPFGFGERPPTRYHVLYSAPDQSEAIAERIARMTSGQRAYEDRRARKAGQTLDAWIRDKYYHDPLPGLIAAFIAACGAFDAGLPTLPSLIQAVTNAAEEQPPQTLPSAQGRTDDAVPAPVGAMAEDDASAARTESPPVLADPAADHETEPLDDEAGDNQVRVANDEADDDQPFDDFEEDETWLAEESLDEWSRKRDICRKAILRTMSDE